MTEGVLDALTEAFQTREIVKVRVLDTAPSGARAIGESLAAGIDGAHLVQVMGRTVVLYREEPDGPDA